MKRLTPSEVKRASLAIPEWKRRGSVISRTWTFADFPESMAFVNQAARAAEKAQHHPDIDIRWNRVTLVLTTHDAGGLTQRDFELAASLDRIGPRPPARNRGHAPA